MTPITRAFLATGLVLLTTCRATSSPSSGDSVAIGSWGGENTGILVEDAVAHVHFGCTLGDFSAPLRLDAEGRFSAAGRYRLRAFPVAVGPDLPAQLTGRVTGTTLSFTVTVNDTVEGKQIVLGPRTVTFGRDAQMGPCPICRRRVGALIR